MLLFPDNVKDLCANYIDCTVIYSTIQPSDDTRWNTDDRIHFVTFHDDDLLKMLYWMFPVFQGKFVSIDLTAVSKILTNVLGKPNIETPEQLKEEYCINEYTSTGYIYGNETIIGKIFDATQFDRYMDQVIMYLADEEERHCCYDTIQSAVDNKSAVQLLTLNRSADERLSGIRFPYIDGWTGVSLFEYAKKLKCDYTYKVLMWDSDGGWNAEVVFDCPTVIRVRSVSPARRFFSVFKNANGDK